MKTIIFDVDDTLYDQALSFHNTFRKLIKGDFTYQEIDQIYKASREHSERLFDKSEKGEISTAEWQTGRIIHALQDFDVPIDENQAAIFHQEYTKAQGNISLFPGMKALLDLLEAKDVQLAILTNGEEEHQSMKIAQLQLMNWISPDNIFISGTYGYAKPKREIFQIVEEKLSCDPNHTIYIGDSFEKDIAGAYQAGWKTMWMNHRKRTIPEASTCHPDKEFHSDKEILDYFTKR